MENKKHIINSLILLTLSLIVRLAIVAIHNFDGLYGQDAFAYYNFASDILYFMQTFNPPPPFFWSIGYPAQLAIAFMIFDNSSITALGVSIIMGSLLPPLLYGLSLQLRIRPAYAFFAGLILAFSGQALQSSLVIMSDIPALFWCLLSFITLLHFTKTRQRRWLPASVLFLSFACLTRFAYLTLLPVYGVILLSYWRISFHIIDLILAIIIGILPVVPQIIFNQINPTPLLNHSWVAGWSPANAFSQTFTNIDGTFHYEKLNTLFYASPIYDTGYLSPLLTVFVFIGILALMRQKNQKHQVLLLGWVIVPYSFLIGIPYQNIRFALIFFPAIVLLVSYGLQLIVDTGHPIRWLCLAIGLMGWGHTTLSGITYAENFVAKQQSEKQIITWLDTQIPPDATLYTFGSTLTLQHYTDYNIIEIYYESPNTLNQRWYRGRTDYLLLNIWQIENQWQRREPQANYHWFRDERGLSQIGKFGNLTLFEASP